MHVWRVWKRERERATKEREKIAEIFLDILVTFNYFILVGKKFINWDYLRCCTHTYTRTYLYIYSVCVRICFCKGNKALDHVSIVVKLQMDLIKLICNTFVVCCCYCCKFDMTSSACKEQTPSKVVTCISLLKKSSYFCKRTHTYTLAYIQIHT